MSTTGFPVSRRMALAYAGAAAAWPYPGRRSVRAAAGSNTPPRPSDVFMSARWSIPEVVDLARNCQATRLEWNYVERGSFFQDAMNAGVQVAGGTVNMCPTDGPGLATYKVGRQQDRFGAAIEAPWVKGKGWYWGCVNSPDFFRLQMGRASRALQAGASVLQHDDCAGAIPMVASGGCWCTHCRQQATRRGYSLERQMLAFQTASTVRYIKSLRSRIDAMSGDRVMMSCNNYRLKTGVPYDLFDYGICEINPADAAPPTLEAAFRQFERTGWMQVVTLRSSDIALNRATIARTHALGGAMLYPYNVYMPVGPRFTANASDVAGLYRFVRAIGSVLDSSRFTNRTAASLLAPESLEALEQAGVSTVVRLAGTQLAVHFIPERDDRSVPPIDVRMAKLPSASTVRSAEQPDARPAPNGTFAISPWDWSMLTMTI